MRRALHLCPNPGELGFGFTVGVEAVLVAEHIRVLVPLLDFLITVRQQDVLPIRVGVLELLEGCLHVSRIAWADLVRRAFHRCPNVAKVGFCLAVGSEAVLVAEHFRVVPCNRTLLIDSPVDGLIVHHRP